MRKFNATCRLKTAVPLGALTDDVLALVDADVHTPGRIKSRWDKKLGNVVDLPCTFTTEDPQAFERHMADVHGRKSTRRGIWSSRPNDLPLSATPMWKAPRLLEDGRPWIDKAGRTAKCRGCGFVVELGRGSDTVIEEHKATCADRSAA